MGASATVPGPGPAVPRLEPGRRAALVGLARTNLALARYLLRHGVHVTGLDRKSEAELGEYAAAFAELGVPLRLGPGYLDSLAEFDLICPAPGVPLHVPELQQAWAAGADLGTEIMFVLAEAAGRTPPLPVIGVTGSAGKTTTTSLIGAMLAASGVPAEIGGNIGTPLVDRVTELADGTTLVLELSSFQLQPLRLSPQIAVVTNVAPNHLDVHRDMAEYVTAKQQIYRHQQADGTVVLNADDPAVAAFAAEAAGTVLSFSLLGPVPAGCYVQDGHAFWVPPASLASSGATADPVPLFAVAEMRLPGRHNVANALAAAAAALCAGATPAAVADAVRSFAGVPHRLELVREAAGVRYLNDSIATTPERTLAALAAVEGPLHLILGGYDKKLPFDALAEAIVRHPGVRTVLLIGATADQIAAALLAAADAGAGNLAGARLPAIVRCGGLEEAVYVACARAEAGETVLLSPACASYDHYRDFAERGEHFRRLVKAL